jgi:MFS family permease
VPVLLAALGVLTISLDAALNIAFPAIAAAFGTDPTAMRWVIIGYVFTYALTAFAAGVLADRVGPGRVFAAGAWITLASYAGFLAVGTSFGALLAVRVVQGFGGGLIYGTAPALITLSLPRERHGRGLAMLTLGMGLGSAVAPPIGGALVDALGWPWVFLFRAPVALLVGVLAVRTALPRTGTGAWRLPARGEWLRWPVTSALVATALANGAQFAIWLLAPFYLVRELGLTATAGAWLFMLCPLGSAVVSPLAGWLADRVGRRGPMVAGLLLQGVALLVFGRFDPQTPLAVVAVGFAAVGGGLGVFQVPNMAQVMAGFPASRQGAAGGLAFMSRTLGVVAGVQSAGAIFSALEPRLGFGGAFAAAFTVAAAACGVAAALVAMPRRPAGEGAL